MEIILKWLLVQIESAWFFGYLGREIVEFHTRLVNREGNFHQKP